MKGSELLEFIKNNKLENEEITIEYFSWERKQKYCGKCNCIVNLNRFHKGTSGLDPDKSSFYRYICRECLNKSAFHKKYKKERGIGSMNSYFDKFGRLHHKPCINGEPAGNNGWIYSAYFHKSKGSLNSILLNECFRDCVKKHPDGQLYTNRHPDGYSRIPQSRDEILGMASLGFLHPMHLNGWNFSPYPIPPFSLKTLIKQVLELRGQHRNYFWKNGLSQIYRFAFSVPLQDRAFLLECFGETRRLSYFFYKAIAFLDAKFGKPKNGIPWLKYGGDERKKIMQAEFPKEHPLR